ncbi:response regulator [Alteromonas sp. a30]|uniref:response regulator n=1 Tax=Alteromonas sp. a30 TaxID=2730917 RepID=UPI002280A1F9|nr:response regulator [Alteromonas sp. a30]MCY7295561.1 response regulator [Alteromonas sp. a30]
MIEIPPIKQISEQQALVIDDQSLVHDVIKSALLELGIGSVRTAENAYYAARLCAEETFDIIIISFNVKSDKDGFHLLEELKLKGHITKSTVVIFLSAETSSSLVNCVIELQPNDFWVKPLDRKKVLERLKQVLLVKRKLYRLHYCVDHQEYASAIYIGERQLTDNSIATYHPHIKRLIGECLMNLREYHDAEIFYQNLMQDLDYGWVKIALARALLKQEKEQEAAALIGELKGRKDTCFMAYDLLAQYYIEHENYAQAYEEIKMATELAPRNIDRNKKSCNLARLNHDKKGQYVATQNMAKYAKNSIHDSPELMLNVIRSGLDLASTLSEMEASKILQKSERLISQLEAEYGKAELKEQINVIQVRMMCLRDEKKKAEALLKEEVGKELLESLEDNLDKVKAFHALGYREECLRLLDELKAQIADDSFAGSVIKQYIEQEALERKDIHFSPKELTEMATEHYRNKRYMPAYMELSKAFVLSPHSKPIAMNVLKVLSALKEQGMLDSLQKENAARAYDLLKDQRLGGEQQHIFQQYSEVLELEVLSQELKEKAEKAVLAAS